MIRSLRCQSCSAPLTVEGDALTTFRCSFCGVVNKLEGAPPAPPASAGPARSSGPVIVGFVGFGMALAAGLLAFFLLAKPSPPPVPSRPAPPLAVPQPARPAPARPRWDVPMGPRNLYWLDQYISPVPVDVTGDGVEDVAGAFILEENGILNAYAGVVDGKSWELLWKAGPWGDRDKARRSTGVAVKEGRLLAVNVLGDAIVFDARSGEQLLSFTFDERDPARWICAPANGSAVFLGNSWAGGTLVNLKTLTKEKASAPAECRSGQRRALDSGDVGQRRAKNETNAAPKLERFDATSWLHDDAVGVMVGAPRGSSAFELVGFDPRKHAVTWRQPVAALAPAAVGLRIDPVDLAEGVYLFSFRLPRQLGHEVHLVAVDPTTGTKLWDALSPGDSVDNVSVSSSRVYAVTNEWDPMPVNVFDLRTGTLLARLGGSTSRY